VRDTHACLCRLFSARVQYSRGLVGFRVCVQGMGKLLLVFAFYSRKRVWDTYAVLVFF